MSSLHHNRSSEPETPGRRLSASAEPASTGPHDPILPAQQARQGITGQNVRYVLGYGLAAVIAAFVVLYFTYFV